jgi:molecular chaperone HtpG
MATGIDSFVLLALTNYKDHSLISAAAEKPDLEPGQEPKEEKPEGGDESQYVTLLERFKQRLGEQISDVRLTDRLLDSPARLVDKEGSMQQEVQRVYRMLKQEYEAPRRY